MAAPAPRSQQGGFVGIMPLLALAVAGVAFAHAITPNFARIGAQLKMPPAAVQSAWKWSKRRGLPFAWVLATIIVESGGNPLSVGDAGCRSKGLMQVNTVAHAQELAAAGLQPNDMHRVDTGVEWGTKVMKDIYDDVKRVVAGRRLKTPIDVTMRLSYKGPKTVEHAIQSGQEPLSLPWAPEAAVRWRNALAHVKAAV